MDTRGGPPSLSPPGQVLQRYGPKKDEVTYQWPVVGQFSSVGSLGHTPKQWLLSELLGNLAFCRCPSLGAGVGKLPSLQLVSEMRTGERPVVSGENNPQTVFRDVIKAQVVGEF